MQEQKKNKTNLVPAILGFSLGLLAYSGARYMMTRDPVEIALSNIDGMKLENKISALLDVDNNLVRTTDYTYKAKGFWLETAVTEKNENGEQLVSTSLYAENPIEFGKKLHEQSIEMNAKIHGKSVEQYKAEIQNDLSAQQAMDIVMRVTLARGLNRIMILNFESHFRDGIELGSSPGMTKGGQQPSQALTSEQKQNAKQISDFLKRVNNTAAEAKGLQIRGTIDFSKMSALRRRDAMPFSG